ncbi:hypothetical protein Tco_0296392 [Tanacetum coccineum]
MLVYFLGSSNGQITRAGYKHRSGNMAMFDDADIRPIDNEEPMAEVQTTADDNVSAKGQQHTEQPEFNNEGKVDQNVEQCHDTCPLPATLTDNQTTEFSNQFLESKNIPVSKRPLPFSKSFLRMKANCVNLELKYQNQALKEGQHGQFSKVKSNEAKVKHDIDVIETINIELEHNNEFQTKDQNDSLMAQLNKKSNENADVLAQIQKKGTLRSQDPPLRKVKFNKAGSKSCFSTVQDSYIKTGLELLIPPSNSNAEATVHKAVIKSPTQYHCDILPELPSDDYVFTMKMEIFEPASNKLLVGEFALSTLDVLQRFGFFLQMGFTLILATLDGLDVGLLGDVIGEDDCDDDG